MRPLDSKCNCVPKGPKTRSQTLRWGQECCPRGEPSPSLTDNALVSSRERLPSWTAVRVEPGSAHVGPARDKRGHTHVGSGAVNTLTVFESKAMRADIGATNKPKSHFQRSGRRRGNKWATHWNEGGSEASKQCLSSALRCCLSKGRKETWKHIICYYSSLRMQRTKGTFCSKIPMPLSPNPSLLGQVLLWPRRVKEDASKGGALGLVTRANREPRTRTQTKGSGAAPPTVGRRQAPPARAGDGLRPAFHPAFRTGSAPRALRTLCNPHPGASDPPAAHLPEGELFAGGRAEKEGGAPGSLRGLWMEGAAALAARSRFREGVAWKAAKMRFSGCGLPTYPRSTSCCPRLRTRLAATAPSSRYSGTAKSPSEPAAAGRTCCDGGWGRGSLGGWGWGWPAVPCAQSATQPSHTK